MVAEAEVVFQQSLPVVLDVQLFGVEDIDEVSSAVKSQGRSAASVSGGLSTSPVVSCYAPNLRHVKVWIFLSGLFTDLPCVIEEAGLCN